MVLVFFYTINFRLSILNYVHVCRGHFCYLIFFVVLLFDQQMDKSISKMTASTRKVIGSILLRSRIPMAAMIATFRDSNSFFTRDEVRVVCTLSVHDRMIRMIRMIR